MSESLLTLNGTTLFYHALQRGKADVDDIQTWAAKVATQTSKPTGRAVKNLAESGKEMVGFFDGDETAEREFALSSSMKGKKRLSSAHLVKIISPREHKRARTDNFTDDGLPEGVNIGDVWKQIFIPTFYVYIACKKDIWNIDVKDAVPLLQRIWDFVYGVTLPLHKVRTTNAVHSVAMQHLSEWRRTLGSTPISIIQAFFENANKNTDKSRQEYAKEMIDNYRFIFGRTRISKDGKLKRSNIFFGPFIIQTFAAHLTAINGANPKIPKLERPGNAIGALALCVTAVERALTMWRDGYITCASANVPEQGNSGSSISAMETAFDQMNWGKITRSYVIAVENNMTDALFTKLINEANAFMEPCPGSDSKATATEGCLGKRACLVNDSDSDSQE